MARGGGVVVPIIADTSGLRKGVQGASSTLRRFGKTAALVAGAAALGGLAKTIQIGTREFMDQQKVAAQTGAVLKSTGGIANVTSKQMENLSESLMRKSGVDDEAIQSGQNLLLTFTKIRNETGKGNDIFNQATKATLDLSVAMGKDLSSSAILVGKALNDPVKGATALSRAGVQLTKGQKDQIQAFVDSGRVLEAQKIILAELTTQFGGSAEAAGKTLPGQLNILKQTFSNLAGDLVSRFLPSLTGVAQKLTDFIGEFAAAPTLTAKIKLVVGSIGAITWRGISSLYEWWTTQGRVELPARVVLTPSGKMQFDQFFRGIEAQARDAGARASKAFRGLFFGLFSSEGRKQAGATIKSIANTMGEVGLFVFRVTGFTLFGEFIGGFFQDSASAFAQGIQNMIAGAFDSIKASVKNLGESAKEEFIKAVRRGGSNSIKNVLTQTVREAVQSARETLAGLGAGLGGTLQTILGATFTRPGGMKPADILAEERKLEDERLALEEKRLTEAANAAEATEEDKLALREFYLNKEKTLRDRALEDEIQNRQRGINDLIESFNKGLISAQTFEQNLRGLIGADLGTELGIAFAGAFERELQTIVNTAKDIASVVGQGQPIAAGGGGVSSALKGENDRRFREALDDYEKRRAQRRKQAEDFRKRAQSDGGSKITDAEAREIREIMAKWDRDNPKPKRADFGLALGGILNKQVFTAAEAGKEAIIPLDSGRGARMLRDALGTGGGTQQNIYLTVNAGLGTNPDELSRVIVDSIKRFEKRNGSVFQSPILPVSANVAGKTTSDSGATNFNRTVTLRKG
jgi:hypothetical protein